MTLDFSGKSIRKGATRLLSMEHKLSLAHCCARSGHEFDEAGQSGITFFMYAMNALDDRAMTVAGGLCLAGWNTFDEKVFPPRIDHIPMLPEEKIKIDIVGMKLFHFPNIAEFQAGGSLRLLLKTLLASLLQYLPQMEKDFASMDHPLIRKLWKAMLDEGFTVTRVREMSELIQHEFYARNGSALQKCKGNITESVVLQEILKGQQLIIQQNNQLKEEHINLKQTIASLLENQQVIASDVTNMAYASSPSSSSRRKRKSVAEDLTEDQCTNKTTGGEAFAEDLEDENIKTKGACVNEKQSAASAETQGVCVNEKLSSVAAETKPDQSADSITLAGLLMLAKEKEAVKNENYLILPSWNTSTKAKANRGIGKMIELMDEEEKNTG